MQCVLQSQESGELGGPEGRVGVEGNEGRERPSHLPLQQSSSRGQSSGWAGPSISPAAGKGMSKEGTEGSLVLGPTYGKRLWLDGRGFNWVTGAGVSDQVQAQLCLGTNSSLSQGANYLAFTPDPLTNAGEGR